MKKDKQPKQPVIRAECHSDDHNVEVDFDAERWFRKATRKEVLALAQCGWRGDYPADAVAESEAGRNEDIAFLFMYVNAIQHDPTKKDCCGFECSVNEDDAMAWLQKNRPKVAVDAVRVANDPAAYDTKTGKFSSDTALLARRISLTTITVQGQDQEVLEVYADDEKEQTLGYVFDSENAKQLAKCGRGGGK